MRFSRRLAAAAAVVGGVGIGVPLIAVAGGGGHGRPPSVGAEAPLAKPQQTVVRSEKNDVSAPLRSLAPIPPKVRREAPENRQIPRLGPLAPSSQAPTAAVQTSAAAGLMPASTSFQGIGNLYGVIPPDTEGDVGPSNYVQFVNLAFAVYSKTGTKQYGPVDGSTLWQGFGGACEADNDGDPIVQYDQLANRWILSQFALPNYPSGPFWQCIAVSQTSSPTGSYYRYAFKFSDTTMNDYPKFGVWPDGYYMSVVEFDANGNYAGPGAVAYDRAKMIAGQPATAIMFDVGSSRNPMLPSDLDGSTPPPAGSPNYYGEVVDGATSDKVNVWAFHVDWATPASSSFTLRDSLTPASFDTNISWVDEPNGYSGWLDAIADRPMYRFAYRNLGSREELVMNHTVNVSGHAGVRWYELRKTTGPWSIFQQGTFSPSSDSRWMGSTAMDGSGDIALGYSISSTTLNPGIRYAGRLASDPTGALSQGEATMQSGPGMETDYSGRWGDYSTMSVDPSDDCTFWYTNEYFPTTGDRTWSTRIGSFKFPSCGGTVTPAPTITGFAPTSGPVGTSVTISGTNFTGATLVEFGTSTTGFAGVPFTVASDTSVTATVPSGKSAGHWRVTTPGGRAISSTQFTVTAAPAPTVTGFSPASGPVGSSVTITGANFTGVTNVQLGTSTSGFVNASYTVGSSTSITATVPGGKPSGRWRVTTSGGSATSAGTFTVTATAAPTVTGFSPTSGPVGSTVTITGTNFTGATAVAIGTSTTGFVNASTFTVVSPTRIDVLVPSGRTAPGHWRVTTPGGRGISSTQFTIT